MCASSRIRLDAKAAATLSTDPRYNSVLRTTCVATRLSGGHADNALPQIATAFVNCRVFPNVTADDVRAKIIAAVADTGMKVSPPSAPIPPTQPSPSSPEIMGPVASITKSMFGDIPGDPVHVDGRD